MSNGRITVELDTRIDNLLSAYSYWLKSSLSEPVARRSVDAARAALEIAIDEAITRGKAEPNAEPAAREHARGLIDKLLSAANARIVSPGWSAEYDSARADLERYIGAMEERSLHYSELQQERIDAINRYNLADAARANLEMRLADAEKERDALRVQMEQMREQLSDELEAAADEIASLNETLASCDSIKLAEELEAMRGQLATARDLKEFYKTRLLDHAERLRVMRGWLDVLAQGYLTPEGVTAGARKAIDALTVIIRDIPGNPKG